MPSTPSSNDEFHDGFDDFFNGEDEALPSLPRNTLDHSGVMDDSDDEALPQIDLSSFSFESETSSMDDDHDVHIEDDEEEYFDDEAWGEEPDEPLNLAYPEEEDEEGASYYMKNEEPWDEDDSPSDASAISDDELDDLLNFDDDSWMDEDDSEEENGENSYYLEDEEQPEGDDPIYLDEEESIDLRKETDQSRWDDDEENSWPQDEAWDDEEASEDDDSTMSLLDDQDEENLPMEDEEENSSAKTKKSEPSPWKSKFADFKRKAQAELQGNSSEGVTDNDEDELDSEEEETPEEIAAELPEEEEEPPGEEQGATRAPRRGSSSGPLSTLRNLAIFRLIGRLLRTRPLLFLGRILRPIKAAYLFVVNTVLKALEWTLGLLGRIPVIGKPFRWLRDLTEVLRYIATCIPVILFIVLVVYLNRSAVPPKADASMPDDGHLTISSMSYDGDTQSAVGTIANDGEIIAEVQPKFTVYSSSPLNPISWAFPKKQVECIGTVVKLEAGESRVVKAKCSQGAGGLFKKTSATLIIQ